MCVCVCVHACTPVQIALVRACMYIYIIIYIYGTVHAKIAYRVYIYKVIKMIHFEIATSLEP